MKKDYDGGKINLEIIIEYMFSVPLNMKMLVFGILPACLYDSMNACMDIPLTGI
jgi:hypothetical protein